MQVDREVDHLTELVQLLDETESNCGGANQIKNYLVEPVCPFTSMCPTYSGIFNYVICLAL